MSLVAVIIRYRLDSTGEFSILSRENNEVMH